MLWRPEKNALQTVNESIACFIDCAARVASIHQPTQGTWPRCPFGRVPGLSKDNLKEQPDVSRLDAR
jgi:hypothetical protein